MNAQPVQPAVKSGKITLDNFVKGFAPLAGAFTDPNSHNYGDKDHFSSYTVGINPYRFINCIAPAAQKVSGTNTNVISDIPLNIVTKTLVDNTSSSAYMIGGGDGATGGSVKLYEVTGTTISTLTNNSPSTPTFPHSVASAKNGYDLKIVTLATGTTPVDYLIYTHDRAGTNPTRKVGLWDFSQNWTVSNAADDAWGSLSSAALEPISFLAIEQGSDGNYYITAGSKVDKITATSASSAGVSAAAVTLPGNYIGLTLRDYKGQMVIGASQKQCILNKIINGTSKVFFWDYVNPTFPNIIDIQDNYLSCLFVKDGDLYAFTGKRNGYSKLRIFTGQSFEIVCEFLGDPPAHNNVDVYKNMIVWVANGQVMSYGRPDKDFPNAYNIIDNNTISGFVKVLLADANYHYHTANAGSLNRVVGAGFDSANNVWSSAFLHLSRKSTVYAVKFYFNQLATGAAVTANYVVNKGGTPTAFAQDSGVISFTQDGGVTEKTFSQNITDVDDFLIYLQYTTGSGSNCVAFNRIEIFYSESGKL